MRPYLTLLLLTLLNWGARAQELMLPEPPLPYNAEEKLVVYSKALAMPGLTTAQIMSVAKQIALAQPDAAGTDLALDEKTLGTVTYELRARVDAWTLVTYTWEVRAQEGTATLRLVPRHWLYYRDPKGSAATQGLSVSFGSSSMPTAKLYKMKPVTDFPIPFEKPKGILAKMIAKGHVDQYGVIDKYFSDALTRSATQLTEAASRAKKAGDF